MLYTANMCMENHNTMKSCTYFWQSIFLQCSSLWYLWYGCTFSWTCERKPFHLFFVSSAWLVKYFSFGIFLPYSLKMHPNSWKASKKNRDTLMSLLSVLFYKDPGLKFSQKSLWNNQYHVRSIRSYFFIYVVAYYLY